MHAHGVSPPPSALSSSNRQRKHVSQMSFYAPSPNTSILQFVYPWFCLGLGSFHEVQCGFSYGSPVGRRRSQCMLGSPRSLRWKAVAAEDATINHQPAHLNSIACRRSWGVSFGLCPSVGVGVCTMLGCCHWGCRRVCMFGHALCDGILPTCASLCLCLYNFRKSCGLRGAWHLSGDTRNGIHHAAPPISSTATNSTRPRTPNRSGGPSMLGCAGFAHTTPPIPLEGKRPRALKCQFVRHRAECGVHARSKDWRGYWEEYQTTTIDACLFCEAAVARAPPPSHRHSEQPWMCRNISMLPLCVFHGLSSICLMYDVLIPHVSTGSESNTILVHRWIVALMCAKLNHMQDSRTPRKSSARCSVLRKSKRGSRPKH